MKKVRIFKAKGRIYTIFDTIIDGTFIFVNHEGKKPKKEEIMKDEKLLKELSFHPETKLRIHDATITYNDEIHKNYSTKLSYYIGELEIPRKEWIKFEILSELEEINISDIKSNKTKEIIEKLVKEFENR